MFKSLISLLSGIFLAGCSMVGIRDTEEAPYQVLSHYGKIEIRAYKPVIIAETLIDADYQASGSIGFKRLAGFIFGDNVPKAQIAMTTPVYRESSGEQIAMTAPVWQQATGEKWLMSFVMPANYTLANLPQPNNPDITIKQMPAKKVAVLSYSGSLSAEIIAEKSQELTAWLVTMQLKPLSSARSAAYDPPWTIPVLRRNEIQIDIE